MNLLDKYKRELEYCTFCPRLCRFECPVALVEYNETYTPTSKMMLVYMAEKGSVKMDAVKEAFYMCVDCKHCITPCIHRIDVPKVLIVARAKVYESGIADDNIKRFNTSLEKSDHPYSHIMEDNLDDVLSYLKRENVVSGETNKGNTGEGKADTTQRVLYFPGCTALRFYKELVKGTVNLLNRLDIHADVIDKPICCGYPGYAAGNIEWFKKTAEKLTRILDNYDVVVSTCPTCINTFKNIYHRYGIDIKAKPFHLLEYIAPRVKSLLSSTGKEARSVAYHDPCHLGRHLGVYDAPRELIDVLFDKRIEFQWSKEDANCCGGGGDLPLTHPKTSERIAGKRMKEFKETGAELLLTACPSCVRWLQKADASIKVMDITEVLINRLTK
ncbi:MAG: (Fe-S)-binding protein [bacterium]